MKLIVFDIDNTLSESRTPVDGEMTELIEKLLERYRVGIISGEAFERMRAQLGERLLSRWVHPDSLFLLPTSGSELYTYQGGVWTQAYAHPLTEEEKEQIRNAFMKVLGLSRSELDYYLEDRNTQMTYAGLGISAARNDKDRWDPDQNKRRALVAELKKYIPEFEMGMGGTTSIDVNKKGMNKGFGVQKLMEYLTLRPEEIMFVGDALYAGGNDQPVKDVGVSTHMVKGPEDTKRFIRDLLLQNKL